METILFIFAFIVVLVVFVKRDVFEIQFVIFCIISFILLCYVAYEKGIFEIPFLS